MRTERSLGWKPERTRQPEVRPVKDGIVLKSNREIGLMRDAGKIAGIALRKTADAVAPGISTYELDVIAEREIRALGAKPSFLGLYGFPASICASINDEIVHGIPNKKRILKEGDLMKIDIGALLNSYHSDTAMTVAVGNISEDAQRLIEVTERSMHAGIGAAKAGNRIRDISAAIEGDINAAGTFGIVRQYVGHGIGRTFHEDPQIPNYVDPDRPSSTLLRVGLVIAIEPMVNLGTWETKKRKGDDWTIFTADGKYSSHFEHTVAITENGPEILTLP